MANLVLPRARQACTRRPAEEEPLAHRQLRGGRWRATLRDGRWHYVSRWFSIQHFDQRDK